MSSACHTKEEAREIVERWWAEIVAGSDGLPRCIDCDTELATVDVVRSWVKIGQRPGSWFPICDPCTDERRQIELERR